MSAVIAMLMVISTITYCCAWDSYAETAPSLKGANSAIAYSGSTSENVYSLHEDRKLPTGCLTKLMTAMVVIDNMHDSKEYSNKVTIDSKIAKLGKLYKKDQEVSVRKLMHDMLCENSDQAAVALAGYSATKQNIFVSEMNSKAVELELMDTEYANPTGAYSSKQYSTVYDQAVIVQHALRYDYIEQCLGENEDYAGVGNYVGCLEGTLDKPSSKTQAAIISEKNGMQIIVVMLGENNDTARSDASSLTSYGIKNATYNTIVKAGKKVGTARVKHGAHTLVAGYTRTKGYAYIPPEGSTSLVQTKVEMRSGLKAPLKKGDKIGEFQIYVADELKGTVDIVCDKDVEVGWFPSYIYISNVAFVIICIILALLIGAIMRIRYIKKRNARMRERKRQQMIHEIALRELEIEEDRRRRNWTYK